MTNTWSSSVTFFESLCGGHLTTKSTNSLSEVSVTGSDLRIKILKAGAHNLERASHSCHGVFTDQLIQLERFWREFRISFKSHKPVSKT